MRSSFFALICAFSLAAPAVASEEKAADTYRSPSEIRNSATAEEWIAIRPSDLIVMDLGSDAQDRPRRVIIQLMPEPFSQGWVRNIRKIAAAKWWDGARIMRVQDNSVVQWGGYAGPDKPKEEVEGLEKVPESDFVFDREEVITAVGGGGASLERMKVETAYGPATFALGWPIALPRDDSDGGVSATEPMRSLATGFSPVHCYGMIGVARGYLPDTGSGSDLYVVIGHRPRFLDRNIALAGRVIEGIENLSTLPRASGPDGFFETPDQFLPIVSIRPAEEIADVPEFEYLSTESESFARYAKAFSVRHGDFFAIPTQGEDICNIPVPVRRKVGK